MKTTLRSTLLRRSLCALLAFTTMISLSITSLAAPRIILENGCYYLYSLSQTTGLNVQYAQKDGGRVCVDTINGESNEIWFLQNADMGYVTLSPYHARNCYLSGERGFDRELIVRKAFPSERMLHWLPIHVGNGQYVFKNRATGYVIDCAYGSNQEIGNRYLNYEQNGFAAAQSIYPVRISTTSTLTPGTRVTNLPSGNFKIALYNDKNQVLNDQYAAGVGGKVICDPYNKESNEIIQLRAHNGLYSLHFSNQPDLCIAPPDIFTDSQLTLRTFDESAICLWELYKVGKTYAFRNAATGLMMDDFCCQTNTGTPIISYSYNGCNAQQFYLTGLITANTSAFTQPTSGRITSHFGKRPSMGDFHTGLDIANSTGTAIKAAASGTVTFAGWKGNYGNLVIIDHGNGYVTYYAHCNRLLVSQGDKVSRNAKIAEMGSTGRSTGPHLHFEIRKNGSCVDPLGYFTFK